MPRYTLNELIVFSLQQAGRRSDIPQSFVSHLVNEAYFEVALDAPPQETERIAVSSTTSGEGKIDLPGDFLEPLSMSLIWRSGSTAASNLSSHRTLARISIAEADARQPDAIGVPTEFAFYNSWIELYPSPNSAYSLQLRYKSMVTDLVDIDQVPSLSTPWRRAIVWKAVEGINRFVDNFAGAQDANTKYLEFVSKLKTDEARRQSGQWRMYATPMYGGKGVLRRPRGRRNRFNRFDWDC